MQLEQIKMDIRWDKVKKYQLCGEDEREVIIQFL